MDIVRRHAKRIAIDAAGYGLIILALLTGWLPGPGGIPLALAGLGLLSINNKWARDLRDYLLKHGGKLVQFLFPQNRIVQWSYDVLAIGLLAIVTALLYQHDAIWQISLAIALFFISVFLAAMNRDRFSRLRKHKH
jgi:hypothetical protein